MSYIQHWIKLWPTADKPVALWKPERGVLWGSEWEACHDHLSGLLAISERCTPPEWEGQGRWIEYRIQLLAYMGISSSEPK